MWDLVLRGSHQGKRDEAGRITGLDFTVLHHMAQALGYDLYALTWLWPSIEEGVWRSSTDQDFYPIVEL